MTNVLRFIMSLIVHMAWQRLGKGAPIPRLRTPKGKTVVLPTLAPWQIMAATWMVGKAWQRYGHAVKSRLDSVDNHWVKQAGGLLPDPAGAPAANAPASNPATANPATPAPSPTPPATPPMPPQYATQVLASSGVSSPPATPSNTNTLLAGSVLNGLRQSPGATG